MESLGFIRTDTIISKSQPGAEDLGSQSIESEFLPLFSINRTNVSTTLTKSKDTVSNLDIQRLDRSQIADSADSTEIDNLLEQLRERLRPNYYLQELSADLIQSEQRVRLLRCMVSPRTKSYPIELRESKEGVIYATGLYRCELATCCSFCHATESYKRSMEIKQACTTWSDMGNSILHFTFTIHHSLNTTLQEASRILADSYKHYHGGRGYEAIKDTYGIVGECRALDFRYSLLTGWNIHTHCLLFLRGQNEIDLDELKYEALERWKHSVEAKGGKASPYGLDIQPIEPKAASYIYKGVYNSEDDTSLTVWDLVRSYGNGNKKAGVRFGEYVQELKGRQKIKWSPNLKKELRLGTGKQSGTIRDRVKSDSLVVSFSPHQWKSKVQTN